MTQSSDARRLALVTGASSGIGRAFARRLGADGVDLIAVGRRRERLEELARDFPKVNVRVLVADLGTAAGIAAVAEVCAAEPLTMLVKSVAPAMLARAAVPGMIAAGAGAIVNVSGMVAFSGPAPLDKLPLRRAVYAATCAQLVAFSQMLHAELKPHGVQVQALCPGIVATEFHERQGLDLSAMPRMSAEDVVSASLAGLALGEVVCAPGVEKSELLDGAFQAGPAAFAGQSPAHAGRYRGR